MLLTILISVLLSVSTTLILLYVYMLKYLKNAENDAKKQLENFFQSVEEMNKKRVNLKEFNADFKGFLQ